MNKLSILIVISICFYVDSYADSCPGFAGKWGRCKLKTPYLNGAETYLLNQLLKPYQSEITPMGDKIRFVGTYKKPFSTRYNLSDETISLDKNYETKWSDSPNGSTPPHLEFYSKCHKEAFVEDIEWINLNENNYSTADLNRFDRFYKTYLRVEKGKLFKKFYSSDNNMDTYKYIATLQCERL